MSTHWYPLKLSFHIRTYAFGERLIPERLGKEGVPAGVIAETWEVSDYEDATATVLNGPFKGKTLHDLTMTYPDELVGRDWRGPHFPLLEKFLDASHTLPVHLHADDKVAREKYAAPNGKTEAWHILWCEEGASILAGVREGASREDLFEAFKAQDYDRVMPRYPISPGDTVYVPGGILHSFGPDTLIFEVQQTSDLGAMVMPTDLYGEPYTETEWDAQIRNALDELKRDYLPKPHPGLALEEGVEEGGNRRVVGCAGPYFALERWRLTETYTEPAHPQRCLTLTNVGAEVGLEYSGGETTLARASSCILPAAIGEVKIVPDGEADLVACYVPDLERDVVEPLRAAGYTDEEIRALGEVAV